MRRWTVSDVMTTDVVTVPGNAGYRAVVDLLAEHRISAVPVVGEDGAVVGVVSEADLLYKVEFAGGDGSGRRPSRARRPPPRAKGGGVLARELMTAPAVTIGPGTSLAAAARLMDGKGVRRLPVVDEDGIPIGVVSRADLLRVHLRPDEQLRREVAEDVLHRVLQIEPAAVDVEVLGGVVTLRGLVDTRSRADLAGQLTAAVPGVVAVENELENELAHEPDDDPGPEATEIAGLGTKIPLPAMPSARPRAR